MERFYIEILDELFNDINNGTEEEKIEFLSILKEFTSKKELRILASFKQHRSTNRLIHCLRVSYSCYLTAKKYNLDYVSATRGGLLHDFCLEDWRGNENFKLNKFWGFYHPKLALLYSEKYFDVNKIERDMILRHMFPLTIIPPVSKEGYVIMFWDRYWCIREIFSKRKIA